MTFRGILPCLRTRVRPIRLLHGCFFILTRTWYLVCFLRTLQQQYTADIGGTIKIQRKGDKIDTAGPVPVSVTGNYPYRNN